MKELILKFGEVVVNVRSNEEGLYCLNDIYRASGSSDGKRPSKFFITSTGEEIFLCSKSVQNGKVKEVYSSKYGVY